MTLKGPPRSAAFVRVLRLFLIAAETALRRRDAGEDLLDVQAAAGIRRLPT
jgi:hypothetical protein